MKLSRQLRSFGAALLCAAMVLCNVPLAQAQQTITIVNPVDSNICGNSTGVDGKCNPPTPSKPATGNTVIVTELWTEPTDPEEEPEIGALKGNVYGGYASTTTEDAVFNLVDIQTGAEIEGSVYGGYTSTGDADDNVINITNSTVKGATGNPAYIVGGSSGTGNADSNTINIKATGYPGDPQTAEIAGYVMGGQSFSGDVTGNTVYISASGATGGIGTVSITGDVYGGKSNSGEVSGNTVEINAGNGGRINVDNVYGGFSIDGGVSGNAVNLNTAGGGTVNVKNVYSNYTVTGDVYGNTLAIEGGSVGTAYAGYSQTGDAYNNWVTAFTEPDAGSGVGTGLNIITISGNDTKVDKAYAGYTESGNAHNNLIDIKIHQPDGVFYGGFSESGDAYENHVRINGGNMGEFHAGHSSSGEAFDNTVVVTAGTIYGDIYGGSTDGGKAHDNSVWVAAGLAQKTIYGGHDSNGGMVYYNQVFIGDSPDGTGTINVDVKDVYGGYSNGGFASYNEVTVSNGYYATAGGNIVGGYSDSVHPDEILGVTTGGNFVTIEEGAVITGGNIYGGQSGSSRENTVIINGGVINGGEIVGGGDDAIRGYYTIGNTVNINDNATVGDVYGGKITRGKVKGNQVYIDGNSTGGNVYGGYTAEGWAEGNSVEINSGTFGDVYGASATDGYANENAVFLNNGKIGSVYGGVTNNGLSQYNFVGIADSTISGNNVVGGSTGRGNALENDVYIFDSEIRNSGASIIGGNTGSGNAQENLVFIDGGSVDVQSVIGGNSSGGNANSNVVDVGNVDGGSFIISDLIGGVSSNGSANDNTVIVGDSSSFSGNFTNVYGGKSGGSGNANGNIVSIYNGVFTNVYGGRADGDGYATGNEVYLNGGTFNGSIYGGFSQSGSATGNTIDISTSAILGAGSRLYGGFTNSARHDARTGNTLNIRKPITITGIDNFENYNFYIPSNFSANNAMITVSSGNGNSGAINLEDANIRIDVNNESLKQGDTVVLIDEKGGFGFNGDPFYAGTAPNGSGLINWTFGLDVEENQLRATILGKALDSNTQSLSYGFLSGLVLANQGADAIAGSAMDSAMTAAHKGPIQGLGAFGSLVAGKTKYDTGSSIDMVGVSAAAGLAIGVDFVNSSLTLGPFFEYGRGEFDTESGSTEGNTATGNGDSESFGGGFLLRMDYKDTGIGRYFAEASVRAGRQKINFSSNWTGNDETYSYSSTYPYYGFHLGYGGSWDVAQSAALDIYGKYFYARGGDSSASLPNDISIDVEASTSNRIRGGSKLAFVPGDSFAISVGGAYEYEISGEANASLLGQAIKAPSLKGGTGIGEVVIGYKPSSESLTSINIGVQGYAGKRQGVTASIFLRF